MTDVAMNANGAAVEHRYGRPILSSLHGLWSIGGFVAAGTTALVTALGVPAELHLVVRVARVRSGSAWPPARV